MLGLPSDNDANTSSDVDECDCFSFGDVSNIDDDNDGDDDDDNKVAGTSPPASSLLSCVRVIKWVRKISIFNSKQYRVSSITCLSLDSSLSADAGADAAASVLGGAAGTSGATLEEGALSTAAGSAAGSAAAPAAYAVVSTRSKTAWNPVNATAASTNVLN
jgi:hypothetical protein